MAWRFAQRNGAVVAACTLPRRNRAVAEGDGKLEAGYRAMASSTIRRGRNMGEGSIGFLFGCHSGYECLPGMAVTARNSRRGGHGINRRVTCYSHEPAGGCKTAGAGTAG